MKSILNVSKALHKRINYNNPTKNRFALRRNHKQLPGTKNITAPRFTTQNAPQSSLERYHNIRGNFYKLRKRVQHIRKNLNSVEHHSNRLIKNTELEDLKIEIGSFVKAGEN